MSVNSYHVKKARVAEREARLQSMAWQLLEQVRSDARVFRSYEKLHRAKGTPEGDEKAQKNAAFAAQAEALVDFVATGKAA